MSEKAAHGHGNVAIDDDFGSTFHGRAKMRTFLASALIIATILIGQQWAAKASAAERVAPASVVAGQR